MKLKRIVLLAAGVVTMGLLLGTSAAQAATVIFENGTTKAIGIKNLDIDETLYNVTFTSTGTVAKMVYGDFPGQFDFSLSAMAFDAVDAVNFELNKNGATGVGAEGSAAVPFFWVGFESELEVDPLTEVVFYQPSFYGEMSTGDNLWVVIQDSANLALYNYGTGVWAKFTEASKETQVIFEGNNATGILNLEVDGKLYNVEFRFDSAENIYGAPPIFDFQDDIDAARSAVIDALNSEPAVATVGPVEADFYLIGFDLKGPYVEVTQEYYRAFGGPWKQNTTTSLTTSTSLFTYADFTEVE